MNERKVWVINTLHGPYRFEGTRLEAQCLSTPGYWGLIETPEEYVAKLPSYPVDHHPPPWTVLDMKPGQVFKWAGDSSDRVYTVGVINAKHLKGDEASSGFDEARFIICINSGGALLLSKLINAAYRPVEPLSSYAPSLDSEGNLVPQLPPVT